VPKDLGGAGAAEAAPQSPWFGYSLGDWLPQWDEAAKRAVEGRYLDNGRSARRREKRRQAGNKFRPNEGTGHRRRRLSRPECLRQLRAAGVDAASTTAGAPSTSAATSPIPRSARRSRRGRRRPLRRGPVPFADCPVRARTLFPEEQHRGDRLSRPALHGQATHFVFVGTSMMYEQNGRRATRREPMRAQGVYSASKLAAFEHVKRLPNRWAAMLPCIIAGPGRGGLFVPFARSIARFGTAVYPGEGGHPVHTVHVEDAASLLVRVVERRATGIFNAASPSPLSIDQWVDVIAADLG